ncbi:MAG: DUF1367 family protein [Actinobacteria bacterium]|nr:DUF1367 family protein [Actinomycetota bacterium]
MKKLFFQKTDFGIIPADSESVEIYKNFSVGDIFSADHWKERNYVFHKKLFRMLNLVCKNSNVYTNPYHLLKVLQFDTKHVDVYRMIDGEMRQTPASIKFRNMGAVKFAELYKDIRTAMEQGLHILLPGMDPVRFRGIAEEIYNEY